MGGDVNLIEETIGTEAFKKLCAWVGGGDYYVPSVRMTAQACILGTTIGNDAADKLMEWAGGSRIYVPTSDEVGIESRREHIKELRGRGMTLAEIALSFEYRARYSVKQISRLLSE